MLIAIDKTKKQNFTDSGVKIESELVNKSIENLEQKKADSGLSVKEKIRLWKIKKQGDNFQGKTTLKKELNKMSGIKPHKAPELKHVIKIDDKKKAIKENEQIAQIQSIIDSIYNGVNPFKAIKDSKIKIKDFYKLLDRQDKNIFKELKQDYLSARVVFSEFCFYRRDELEKQLLNGEIDCSTYSALSADYKYLAGKLAPLIYGDKIQIEQNINHTAKEIDFETIKQLKSKLDLQQITDQSVIDADFTELKD